LIFASWYLSQVTIPTIVQSTGEIFWKNILHIGILHGTYGKAQYAIYHGFFILKSKTGSVNAVKMLKAGTKFCFCVRNTYTSFSNGTWNLRIHALGSDTILLLFRAVMNRRS
jgi:hypothetical protein